MLGSKIFVAIARASFAALLLYLLGSGLRSAYAGNAFDVPKQQPPAQQVSTESRPLTLQIMRASITSKVQRFQTGMRLLSNQSGFIAGFEPNYEDLAPKEGETYLIVEFEILGPASNAELKRSEVEIRDGKGVIHEPLAADCGLGWVTFESMSLGKGRWIASIPDDAVSGATIRFREVRYPLAIKIGRCSSLDLEESLSACTAVIQSAQETEANRALAFMQRGVAYSGKNQYDLAIADYDEAIRVDANLADAFYHRGAAYAYKGQYDRAIRDYDQAIHLNPDLEDAFYNRGTAYLSMGQYSRAIDDFARAILRNPIDAEAFKNRSVALRALARKNEAEADLIQSRHLRERPVCAIRFNMRPTAQRGEPGVVQLLEGSSQLPPSAVRGNTAICSTSLTVYLETFGDKVKVELRQGVPGNSRVLDTQRSRGGMLYFGNLSRGSYFMAIGDEDTVSVTPVRQFGDCEQHESRIVVTRESGNVTRRSRKEL